ncbi:UNVERIFIED_CONTAM: hypothetical protein FKN15_010538 [Acipenser sinensis]
MDHNFQQLTELGQMLLVMCQLTNAMQAPQQLEVAIFHALVTVAKPWQHTRVKKFWELTNAMQAPQQLEVAIFHALVTVAKPWQHTRVKKFWEFRGRISDPRLGQPKLAANHYKACQALAQGPPLDAGNLEQRV